MSRGPSPVDPVTAIELTTDHARMGGDAPRAQDIDDHARSVLRVDASGRWPSDLAGHVTALKAYGEDRDDTGLNLSLDALVDHHDQLRLADIAALQMASSSTVNAEAEVAYLGPKLDKDGHITAALGVANRIPMVQQ